MLHDTLNRSGMPTASLWAAVPGYASQLPRRQAALALVERACSMMGTPAPLARLAVEAADYDARVAALIADDDDLVEYLSRLEDMVDDDDDDDDDDDLDDPTTSTTTPMRSWPRSNSSSATATRRRSSPRGCAGRPTSDDRALGAPDRCADRIERRRRRSAPAIAANAIGPHHCAPAVASGSASAANQPTPGGLQRVPGQLATGRAAVEQQHVHPELG